MNENQSGASIVIFGAVFTVAHSRKHVAKVNASFAPGDKADCAFHLRSRVILLRPFSSGPCGASGAK